VIADTGRETVDEMRTLLGVLRSDPGGLRVIRVLLADDQALVRGGFRLILEAEPDIEVAGEAADGDQAVTGALDTRPDLVLMDIRMPVLDGIEAARRLLPQLDGTRVVMLTTFDLDDYVVDAFRAGASGFLLKTAPPAQLVVEPSTVKSHVASLLAKLGLRDRVQAVIFAYENGLIVPGTR
jgi:DNA-binding NarL/FixJ family response regulator